MRIVFWVLSTITLVIGALCGVAPFVVNAKNEQLKIIGASGNAFTAAGVMIALAGFLYSLARDQREADEKRSRFYLDACGKAYEEAKTLLADGNNDRATWIAAARALQGASNFAKKVKLKDHLTVLEIDQMRYRRFFHDCISRPATFFYGVKGADSLRAAAAASTAPQGDTISTALMLSEKSLHVVWRAARWPDDYNDPLSEGFSEIDCSKTMVLYRGLYEFLEFEKQHHSVAGVVHERSRAE